MGEKHTSEFFSPISLYLSNIYLPGTLALPSKQSMPVGLNMSGLIVLGQHLGQN